MTEEFNLSKRKIPNVMNLNNEGVYRERDIKKFIKRLKEEIEKTHNPDFKGCITCFILSKLDKLTGDDLIK